VAVGLVSATIGYWVGVGSNLNYTNTTPQYSPASSEKGENAEGEASDEEGYGDGNLGDVKAGMMEECKLVSTSFFSLSLDLYLSIGPCG
jgi:PTH2 family peptidyl-tRNA hydrolase